MKTKKDLAIQFINEIRSMPPEKLQALIVQQAGDDLAGFFMAYADRLISTDPERAVQNASSLMLMGYLIRSKEVAADPVVNPFPLKKPVLA